MRVPTASSASTVTSPSSVWGWNSKPICGSRNIATANKREAGREDGRPVLQRQVQHAGVELVEAVERPSIAVEASHQRRAGVLPVAAASACREQSTGTMVTATSSDIASENNGSKRKERLLVRVNCAALPGPLIESELFGREKGAYTGALSKEAGRFGTADGGTLFLDEVGELPLELQAKLLRVLETGTFERLGSSRTVKVDVRLVAATNRDLGQAVREGRFRQDLFFRLQVFPIQIPPLRDRREDIPPLVWMFVKQFGQQLGRVIEHVPRQAMEALVAYAWPGNIRELRNVIERSMILTDGLTLRAYCPAARRPHRRRGPWGHSKRPRGTTFSRPSNRHGGGSAAIRGRRVFSA